MRTASAFAIAWAALPAARALVVTPGSDCETKCGNVLDSTSPDEIVCKQQDYSTTDAGKMFTDCLTCLEHSVYTQDGKQTDTQWMLYNLRYALAYCLFDVPEKHPLDGSPCQTSEGCGHYEDAIVYKNMSSDVSAYEYCDAWPGDKTFSVARCQKCLFVDDNKYMANYIAALEAGCEQKPDPGLMIGLDGDIFKDDMVNATAASPTASVNPDWFDNGPLTLPVKVGIAAGGVVLILMLLGACIVWNGRRRRRAFLRRIEARNSKMGGWPSPQQQQQQMRSYPFPQAPSTGNEMHDTPLSQRPLRGGWDDSPMTAGTDEKGFPRYFSPYSSQYNSPISAQDTPAPQWQTPATQNIGVALGGDDERDRWTPPSPPSPESYEMHHVESAGSGSRHVQPQYPPQPPTLAHPGYGRTSESPPRRYGLNDPDAPSDRAF